MEKPTKRKASKTLTNAFLKMSKIEKFCSDSFVYHLHCHIVRLRRRNRKSARMIKSKKISMMGKI